MHVCALGPGRCRGSTGVVMGPVGLFGLFGRVVRGVNGKFWIGGRTVHKLAGGSMPQNKENCGNRDSIRALLPFN